MKYSSLFSWHDAILAQMCWDSKYFEAIIYCLSIRIDSFCNLSLRLTSYLIIYKIMCVCKQPPSCHFKTLRSMWIEWALDINLCNINGHKKCKNVSNRKANQTVRFFFMLNAKIVSIYTYANFIAYNKILGVWI